MLGDATKTATLATRALANDFTGTLRKQGLAHVWPLAALGEWREALPFAQAATERKRVDIWLATYP